MQLTQDIIYLLWRRSFNRYCISFWSETKNIALNSFGRWFPSCRGRGVECLWRNSCNTTWHCVYQRHTCSSAMEIFLHLVFATELLVNRIWSTFVRDVVRRCDCGVHAKIKLTAELKRPWALFVNIVLLLSQCGWVITSIILLIHSQT